MITSLPRMLTTAAILATAPACLGQGIGGMAQFEDGATVITERLGAPIAARATFRNSEGETVAIADYLATGRPLILNLQYFGCPSLCGRVMNGLVDALDDISLSPGKDFHVLSVSFDSREEPELAARKRASLLERYTRDGAKAGWHFLTGDQENIDALTKSVGFGLRWNETLNDWDHRAAIIFVAPSGTITRYLNRSTYEPRTLKLAIVEASEGKVGTALDRFVLSCYGYDPRTGTYSSIGPVVMTIGGVLTLGALTILLFVLWRREFRQVVPAAAAT